MDANDIMQTVKDFFQREYQATVVVHGPAIVYMQGVPATGVWVIPYPALGYLGAIKIIRQPEDLFISAGIFLEANLVQEIKAAEEDFARGIAACAR